MRSWLKRPIALSVFTSIVAALLISGIQYFLSLYVRDSTLSAFIAAFVALLIVLVGVQLQIINPFKFLGARYLDRHTGITKVFPSLEDAFPELKQSFQSARRIDLLVHIGRQEFGVKEALFSDLLEDKIKAQEDLEVRILHMAEDSPYLSESRAKMLGKRREKWVMDVKYVREQITAAAGGAANVQILGHNEPFVWRLFIFDETMFVSGYLHRTKNDKKAPVYRIREGESSLYPAFKNYYDHLWALYSHND